MFLAVVLTVSILLTLVTFFLARGWEAGRAHSAFRGISSDRVNAIAENVMDEALKLEYLKSFYVANAADRSDIIRFGAEFQSLARDAFLADSEIDLLGYAPRLAAKGRSELTSEMRSAGHPDFDITERSSTAELVKAPPSGFYYPITALEPGTRYPSMLGFDLWKDPVIRQVLQASTSSRSPEMSAPVGPLDGSENGMAVWMAIPLSDSATNTTAAGFVIMRVRVDRLVENALVGMNPAGIDLFVYDAPAKGPESLIYTHPSRTRTRAVPVTSATPDEKVPFDWSTTISLGQRHWRIEARPAPAFIRAHTYWLSWIVLAAGLFSTAILAGFVLLSLRRADRVEEIVGRRTAELSEAVAQHRSTEESLQIAHNNLTEQVETIHRRTRELELLSEMGDLLQTCRNIDEAYEVVAKYAGQLFPTERGALYAYDDGHRLLDRVSVWGEWPEAASDILPDECWALRRGKIHVVQGPDDNLICDHLSREPGESASICLPLVASGETLGLLHLRAAPSARPEETYGESKQRLVTATGEHAAMAFANLKLRESLRQQSIRDPLTGLFNRRYMEESLDRELHRARRSGPPLSVVMMDIDHFKKFNDTYGHEAGDVVLRSVGQSLLHFVRAEDIPCRFGGEELVLILPGATKADGLQKAEGFRKSVQSLRAEFGGQRLPEITMSLGVAALSDRLAEVAALLGAADEALYRAKKGGRNRVEGEANSLDVPGASLESGHHL